jgi:lysozyme family protein
MSDTFDKCFDMLMKHEGGYTADSRDPGNYGDGHGNPGSTNLGVTSAVYAKWTGKPAPREVMKKLTKEDVAPIYKKNYWDRNRCDDLPSGVDWSVFDMCVNSGSRGAKILQKSIGATPDGGIGPKTLALVEGQSTKYIIERFAELRQQFYEGLSTFKTFGKGWTRRTKETKEQSLKML